MDADQAQDYQAVADRGIELADDIAQYTLPATWATLTPEQKDEALRRSLVALGKLIRLVIRGWRG